MPERSPSDDSSDHLDDDDPTWPPVVCPMWCTGGHRASDHPEDRIHRSRAVLIPAIVRRDFLTPGTDPIDLLVYSSRPEGTSTTWCSIVASEHSEPRINLTLESADMLRDALTRVVSSSRG